MKVYKVLELSFGRLMSYSHDSLSSSAIEYEPNKVIVPKVGKLFCFGDIESVYSFFERGYFYSSYRVWEAEAESTEPIAKRVRFSEDDIARQKTI